MFDLAAAHCCSKRNTNK